MKKENTSVVHITANTILIWVSIIATFVVAIIALLKQTPSTTSSSSSGGDTCNCNYDDIANYLLTQKNFMQNYTEIKPSKITLQNGKDDEDNAFSIEHNDSDNSVTFITQDKNVYFDGRMARLQFSFGGESDANPDIVRFYLDDDHYWYYSYHHSDGLYSN